MTEFKRVGAILDCDSKTKEVKFLGYGNYLGDEVPDDNARGLCQQLREIGMTNPKIQLDNGDVVWGGECWWNDETEVQAQIREFKKDGYKIENVDINKVRERQDSP